jgi:hypothetical protein
MVFITLYFPCANFPDLFLGPICLLLNEHKSSLHIGSSSRRVNFENTTSNNTEFRNMLTITLPRPMILFGATSDVDRAAPGRHQRAPVSTAAFSAFLLQLFAQ